MVMDWHGTFTLLKKTWCQSETIKTWLSYLLTMTSALIRVSLTRCAKAECRSRALRTRESPEPRFRHWSHWMTFALSGQMKGLSSKITLHLDVFYQYFVMKSWQLSVISMEDRFVAMRFLMYDCVKIVLTLYLCHLQYHYLNSKPHLLKKTCLGFY